MTAHESHEFTPAECAAMDCMISGLLDKQAAGAIGVSPWTVSRLIASAQRKVGAKTRGCLAAIVVRRGLA